MPICALYFPENFADKNWADLTFAIEAPRGGEGIARSGEWLLGRHPAADLTFAIKDVSRRHAVIGYSYIHDTWTIADLGSATGTRVRGKALEPGNPEPLNVGDRIWLGANMIVVVEDEGDTIGSNDPGPPTIADTKPLDYRPNVEQPPAPLQAQRTHADSAYLALQWMLSPSTMLGVVVRLLVLAVAAAVAVLVFD